MGNKQVMDGRGPVGSRTAGFTLVELVMVIVILGLLAATALPKFFDLGCEARVAVIEQSAGAIRSGAAMVFAKAVVMQPKQTGQYGQVTLASGETINTNYGYPNAAHVYHRLLVDPSHFTAWSSGSYLTEFRLTDAPDPSNCKVSYVAPSSAGDEPVITTVTSGCGC